MSSSKGDRIIGGTTDPCAQGKIGRIAPFRRKKKFDATACGGVAKLKRKLVVRNCAIFAHNEPSLANRDGRTHMAPCFVPSRLNAAGPKPI